MIPAAGPNGLGGFVWPGGLAGPPLPHYNVVHEDRSL
jgi:hypothetical protein